MPGKDDLDYGMRVWNMYFQKCYVNYYFYLKITPARVQILYRSALDLIIDGHRNPNFTLLEYLNYSKKCSAKFNNITRLVVESTC